MGLLPRAPQALRLLSTSFVALILATTPSAANWFSSTPQPATAQAEGTSHRGPSAYHDMCARTATLCMYDRRAGLSSGTGPAAHMDERRWGELVEVNDRLNRQIREIEDRDNYGVEDYWTLGTHSGDCEDFIIAKKHALMEAGWVADQLLYAVVEGRYSAYHAVLVVRTDWGDYVLDNLTGQVLPWEETGYRFVIRQSAENPHRWAYVTGATPRLAQLE